MDMDGLAGICVGAAAERETCAGQILLWTTWLRSGQNPLPGDTYSESGCAARHRFPLITHSPSLGPSQGFGASRTPLRAPTASLDSPCFPGLLFIVHPHLGSYLDLLLSFHLHMLHNHRGPNLV